MEKYYHFAGLDLAVRLPQERMYDQDRQLEPFRVTQVRNPHVFDFEIVEELAEPCGEELTRHPGFVIYRQEESTVRYIGTVKDGWNQAYLRACHRGKHHHIQLKASQFPDIVGTKTVLNAMEAEHLVLEQNGVLFHSAYIAWQGKGILFTAPSGTGKSTQAELWKQHRGAEIINGDRSVIRITEDGVYAQGIPFSGSSQYCLNRTLPLSAIVYLGQAPQTSISRLRGVRAFRSIWEGISLNTWNREDVRRATDLVGRIASEVPVFYLPCTPDESAILALEEALRKQV